MDLSFFRRSEARFAGRQAARLDYSVLVASLEAAQSASAGARAARAADRQARPEIGRSPLAELLNGGALWREALAAQGGSFNPVQAARCGKAP